MSIEIKSIGTLIDELITCNIKCFMAQDTLMEATSDKVMAEAAKSAQKLNSRRNQLIIAIDTRLGDSEITQSLKTYKDKH